MVWAFACGGARREHAVQPATREPLYGTTQGPSVSGKTRDLNARELRVIEELIRTAERVRGLRFRRRVPVSVQDPTAIMSYVDDQMEAEQLGRTADTYRALGLLPEDIDVRELLLRLMGEQIVGYYDADKGRLVVRDDVMRAFSQPSGAAGIDLEEARIVLVHELVHALQDQNLGLSENLERERDSDENNAFRALIEGDATLAMIAFALERESVDLGALTSNPARVHNLSELVRSSPLAGSELNNAPDIVRTPLLSAYVDGLSFVANLHGDGGWGRVDRCHSTPPQSTEQVLHPERYARFEAPDRPRLRQLPAAMREEGYEALHEDTLGELEMRVYFGQAVPPPTAARAAAGWGGDRLYAFRHEELDETAIVWVSTWDSEDDAREAAEAAEEVRRQDPPSMRAGQLVRREGKAVLIGRWLTREMQALSERHFEKFVQHAGRARLNAPQGRGSHRP